MVGTWDSWDVCRARHEAICRINHTWIEIEATVHLFLAASTSRFVEKDVMT
jgi:hypothetical protein